MQRTTFSSCLLAFNFFCIGSIGSWFRETQCMGLKSHQLWFSCRLDFLAYLKDQVLGWYLNVVLGFMEAYFLLALVPHKSQLICCCGFPGEAFWWHWSKWSQTTNTNKGVTLSIANVWAGLLLSDLLLLTSRSLHKFQIYLRGLDPGSYWPTERSWYMNTFSFKLSGSNPCGTECCHHFLLLFCHWSFGRFLLGTSKETRVHRQLPGAGAFPRSTAPHRVRVIRPGE